MRRCVADSGFFLLWRAGLWGGIVSAATPRRRDRRGGHPARGGNRAVRSACCDAESKASRRSHRSTPSVAKNETLRDRAFGKILW